MGDWLDLFLAFFLANILGYGGGPASIPLMYEEIVNRHHWMNDAQFSNLLALGNTLPGPIATKIAASVGYQVSGWPGMLIAIAATVVPSAVALILLLKLLSRFKTSDSVRGMTLIVQPLIAVMMLLLTWQMASASVHSLGLLQSLGIAAVSFWLLRMRKVHPALLIVGAFVYGGAAAAITM